MTRTLGTTSRATLRLVAAAIALCSVVPLTARAESANSACDKAIELTQVPGFSVSGQTIGAHEPAGVAQGTVGKNRSNWWKGILHDVAVVSQQPLTLTLLEYQKGTGCEAPIVACQAQGTASAPARCQLPSDSARYFIEVRNSGDVSADYQIATANHCYVKKSDASCAVLTP